MQDSLPQHDNRLPCAEFRALLDDIAADHSDAVTCARVQAHALACPPCRMALAAARAYRRAMRRVGEACRATDAMRVRALELLRDVRGSRQA
jgi:hypothetical protein